MIRLAHAWPFPQALHGPLQEHEEWHAKRSDAYRVVATIEAVHADLCGRRWYWVVYDGTQPPHVRTHGY